MDDGAITGLKTSESRVSCEKRQKRNQHLSDWGKAFQSLGAELEKALKLIHFLLWFLSTLGIQRWDWEDGLKHCGGSQKGISSWKYCGAVPMKQLYASERILWWIWSFRLHRKPVELFFSRRACCVLSSLSMSQSLWLCSAQVEDGAIPDLWSHSPRPVVPLTNTYCNLQ